MNEIQLYYDSQIKAITDVLEELDKRITRLEEGLSCPGKNPPHIEAELSITKSSLKKVRDAIMNMFR